MSKWKIAVVGALILAFVAGIPVGWMFNPFDGPVDDDRYNPSWLHAELELTDSQTDQMREIWTRAAQDLEGFDRAQFARDKDDVIREILTEEQRAQYDEIEASFRQRREARDNEKRARHQAAIEETMSILSDEQRSKFEELLEVQRDRGKLPMLGGRHRGEDEKR